MSSFANTTWKPTTNSSWIPPFNDSSVFSFKNCTLAAQWLSGYLGSGASDSYYPTIDMLRDGLGTYWKNRNLDPPTDDDLFIWWIMLYKNQTIGDYLQAMANFTMSKGPSRCYDEFCRTLPWEGNPDLAGRGMLVTYCAQAVLTTIYLLVIIINHYNMLPVQFRRHKHTSKVIDAFQESTRAFLDATLIFSISALVASIFSYRASLKQFEKGETPTSFSALVLIMTVALYSIFPAIILHLSTQGHLERKKTRKAVWVLIAALIVTLFGLFLKIWFDVTKDLQDYVSDFHNPTYVWGFMSYPDELRKSKISDWPQLLRELICINLNIFYQIKDGLIACFATLAFFTTLCFILVSNILRIPWFDPDRSQVFGTIHEHAWAVFGVLALFPMWALFVGFWLMRNRIDENSSTYMNKDHEWGFGQWLAMATWAPVLFEWIIILRIGPERALSGLSTDRYRTFKVDQLPEREKIEAENCNDGSQSGTKSSPVRR